MSLFDRIIVLYGGAGERPSERDLRESANVPGDAQIYETQEAQNSSNEFRAVTDGPLPIPPTKSADSGALALPPAVLSAGADRVEGEVNLRLARAPVQ